MALNSFAGTMVVCDTEFDVGAQLTGEEILGLGAMAHGVIPAPWRAEAGRPQI